MHTHFDAIVVGGGPVGWACALAMVATNKTLDVAVVDRIAPPSMPQGRIGARVYTVSEDHLRWLNDCGVTIDTTRSAQVERIRVYDQAHRSVLAIDTRDARKEKIAAIVEHDALTAAIATRALEKKVHFVQGEVKATDLLDGERFVELVNGTLLNAKLVIVAQGADARLVEALGVEVLKRDYDRVGVVANFATETPHRNEAQQWFLPDGSILALLPLPNDEGDGAVSMVWSTTSVHASALETMSLDALCAEISQATQAQVRPTRVNSPCKSFPLKLSRVADPVLPRALIVGDAAHAIHPLAGQGVNLGLADARALGDALARASEVRGDIGHALLLAKFRRCRYAAVAAMQTATDALARIYNGALNDANSSFLPTAAVSDLGMRVLGAVPAFRRMLSSVAS
ncbi:MAG: FAD-dependent monooxygenase [Casimicrobium sp.]